MLFYLPLESYVERYTYFMSCRDGWAETHFKNNNVDFVRVDGEQLGQSILTGSVLDAHGRCYYAMTQTAKLIKLLQEGKVKDDDVVYLEDFWHPGVESLFYIRSLSNVNFKIGTFLHAQSVDDTDFTYSMRNWMRPIEQGYGVGYDFIFVTSKILKGLCVKAGIGVEDKIHNIGLPFNSKRLKEQLANVGFKPKVTKSDYVLFSSRFDDEKDPNFFLDVVEACPNIEFKLVKPRAYLTKNEQVLMRVDKILNQINSNLEVVDTRNKVDYYDLLSGAKVQFNCAHQDWVSWTLLEAITFKCNPLYPIWKDFPVELHNDEKYLYNKRDLKDAEKKLRKLMNTDFDESLNYVVEKHDKSWYNYLQIMGVINV